MPEAVTGLNAVTVHITDIEKARHFYAEVLGLKETGFDARTGRIVFALPETSTVLSMHVQGPGEGGREPGTVTGLVFRHPDPVAACALIRSRGGTIVMEPALVELPGQTFHRAVIADPDGNEFLISDRRG